MQRLLHGLVDDVGGQAEQRADARRGRWPEMRDMVDLVLVEANRPDEIDLDLVAGGEPAHERPAIGAALLGHREDGRDVVAGMAVFGGEEGVVIVELADGGAVGPGGPFGMHPHIRTEAEDGGAAGAWMGSSLIPRRRHGVAVDRRDGHRGIVDDPVDDHLGDGCLDLDRIGGHFRDLPGKLALPLQPVCLGMNPNVMSDHDAISLPSP